MMIWILGFLMTTAMACWAIFFELRKTNVLMQQSITQRLAIAELVARIDK